MRSVTRGCVVLVSLWLGACECGASEEVVPQTSPSSAPPSSEAPARAAPADDWIALASPSSTGGCFDAARTEQERDVVCGGLRVMVTEDALRWADDATAEPIVAARRVADDDWVFLTLDGLTHRATGFVGHLETAARVSGTIYASVYEHQLLRAPHGDASATPSWIDDRARAWFLGASGAVTRIAPSIDAPIVDVARVGDRALVVAWPGRLYQVSGDTTTPVDLGDAVATAVSASADQAHLYVTATTGLQEVDASGTVHAHAGPVVVPLEREGPYDEAIYDRLARASWDHFPGAFAGGPSVWSRAFDVAVAVTPPAPDECDYALRTAGGFSARCGDRTYVSADGASWERSGDESEFVVFGTDRDTWIVMGSCGDGVPSEDTYCWHTPAGEREVQTSHVAPGMLAGDGLVTWSDDGATLSVLTFGTPTPTVLVRPGDGGGRIDDASLTATGELVMRYDHDGRPAMAIGPRGGPFVEHVLPRGAWDVAFADGRHGISTGDGADVWTTIDGGATWTALAGEPVPLAREIGCGAHYCATGTGFWGAPDVVRPWGEANGTRVVRAQRDEAIGVPPLERGYDCERGADGGDVFAMPFAATGTAASTAVTWWPIDGDTVLHAHGALRTAPDEIGFVAGSTALVVLDLGASWAAGTPDGTLTRFRAPVVVSGGEMWTRCASLFMGDEVLVDVPGGVALVRASGVASQRAFPEAHCRVLDGRDASGPGRALACGSNDPLTFARLDGTTAQLPALGDTPLAFCDAPHEGATQLVTRASASTVFAQTYTDTDVVLELGEGDRWCVRMLRVAPRGGIDPGFGEAACVLPRFLVTGARGETRTLGPMADGWSCHPRE